MTKLIIFAGCIGGEIAKLAAPSIPDGGMVATNMRT